MKDRIKELRKHEKLNQTEFGALLGVSLSAVQKWESGENTPAESVIKLMCQKTGVDEVWLRTGDGEPFRAKTRKDKLSEYFGQVLDGDRTETEMLLIEVMSETPVEEWETLASALRKFSEKIKKPDTE